MNIKEEIEKIIEGETNDTPEVRKKFSTDASIFEVVPQIVVAPKNREDISALVNFTREKKEKGENSSLTPRVGGTCMSGGALSESIVLDLTKYLNKVSDLVGETITIESGAYHRELERKTKAEKLLLASYTSSKDICGIGGMLGNNASGERSIKHGATDKQVLSLKAILSDGKEYEFHPLSKDELDSIKEENSFLGKIYQGIYELIENNISLIREKFPKVKKNAAGYALNEVWNKDKTEFNLGRLFVGSQGTLGIITEATFKLAPVLENVRMLVVPLTDIKTIHKVVEIFHKFNADIIETFDHHTYDLAKQYTPDDAKRAEIAEDKHMVIFGEWGSADANFPAETAKAAKIELEKNGFEALLVEEESVAESFLAIRRASFKMLLEHPHKDSRAAAFLEDTIVPIEHYGDFLGKLEKILAEYDLTYTYAGHIGDGSIRLVPLVNFEKAGVKNEIMELSERVYDLVFQFGGSMSADHNDGFIRTPFLEKMYGTEMKNIFQEVKNIFDPLDIFNSGKKTTITLKEAKSHILESNRPK